MVGLFHFVHVVPVVELLIIRVNVNNTAAEGPRARRRQPHCYSNN